MEIQYEIELRNTANSLQSVYLNKGFKMGSTMRGESK